MDNIQLLLVVTLRCRAHWNFILLSNLSSCMDILSASLPHTRSPHTLLTPFVFLAIYFVTFHIREICTLNLRFKTWHTSVVRCRYFLPVHDVCFFSWMQQNLSESRSLCFNEVTSITHFDVRCFNVVCSKTSLFNPVSPRFFFAIFSSCCIVESFMFRLKAHCTLIFL